MVFEIIRWTLLPYTRRTARQDLELAGKTVVEGDQVALRYLSGDRHRIITARPNAYWIARLGERRRLSFGCGNYRSLGNRLAPVSVKNCRKGPSGASARLTWSRPLPGCRPASRADMPLAGYSAMARDPSANHPRRVRGHARKTLARNNFTPRR
jgi:hypothetical protein